MKKTIKQRWIKALLSGKYKQGTGSLYNEQRYCCLGVLCRVSGIKTVDIIKSSEDCQNLFPGPDTHLKTGLARGMSSVLASLNDGDSDDCPKNLDGTRRGMTFMEIAKFIRETC